MTMPDPFDLTPETLAELRRLAKRADYGELSWARWLDQDGAPHMGGRIMVGNAGAVIPDGEWWVDGVEINPVAECYTPELADFIAAANPAVVLALLDAAEERDALRAERDALRSALSFAAKVHAAVEFDTPQDNATRDRAVAVMRRALDGEVDR